MTRELTKEENNSLPFDFKNQEALQTNEGTTYFTATFKGEKIYTYDLDGDWGYWSKQANKITHQAYATVHPDLGNITDFDIKTRNARYNNKAVCWSDSAQAWVYGNNKKVNFDNA